MRGKISLVGSEQQPFLLLKCPVSCTGAVPAAWAAAKSPEGWLSSPGPAGMPGTQKPELLCAWHTSLPWILSAQRETDSR